MTDTLISKTFEDHAKLLVETKNVLSENITDAVKMISESLANSGTLFWCGNGGSAADSQHMAAEFVGRFKKDRKPLRSIALTTDSSVITCVSNDYCYDDVFVRQIEALGRPGDVLVAISTSGQSENVKRALNICKIIGVKTIALLGKDGGVCKELAEIALVVPSDVTARIQEMHILIEHLVCELVEVELGYG
ncbi:MAG: D-sedoheptulose 7-phosphate isomerase [Gammaproteobacteria bacterium]|nr:D-sedoheptulose 7-phosphate isomerase [Gammaproteobacteria bacterium]